MKPMETPNPYWIWLAELKGVNIKTKLKLLHHFSTPENLWSADGLDLPPLAQGHAFVSNWKKLKNLDPAKRLLERNERLGIKLWTIDSEELVDPVVELRPSADTFLVVYALGNPQTGPSAAVIGTRQASGDGYHAAEMVCKDLIRRGVCINSGMAVGIDSFAHNFALAEGGRTQGFAAHGLDQCYPSEHYGLMRRLSEDGAVLSPYPLGTEPYKANFLRRNALMSLWSEEVILIEAGVKSGALNTAEHALRQGKRLWVVPGRPGSKQCAGNQRLLDQGLAAAYPVTLGLGSEHPVLELLRGQAMSTQAIAEVLNLPLNRLEQDLLSYEKHLKVAYLPDGRWHYRGW
jgi:DNA processing protein